MPDTRGGKSGGVGDKAARAQELLSSAEGALKGGAGGDSKAVGAAVEASAILKEVGDRKGTAHALRVVAQLHLQAGEPEPALQRADEALDLFLALQPRSLEEARAASCAVEALLQLGQAEAALRAARDAREAFQEAGFRSGEALMMESLASVYAAAGSAADAERLARRALRIHAAEPRDAEGEKRVLQAIATLRLARGAGGAEGGGPGAGAGAAPASAFAAAGDVRAAAETLYGLAEAHAAAGRAAEVLAEAEALRDRCREARDTTSEGIALLAASYAHVGQDAASEGLRAAREAAELFEEKGEVNWWACALAAVARAYSEKGQTSMVQQYARRASRKFAESSDRSAAEVSVRLLLVHSLLSGPEAQRKPQEAGQEAEAALVVARDIGDRTMQVTALGALTQACSACARHEEALKAANRALQLLDAGDLEGRAQLLLHCADVHLVLRQFEEALGPASEMVDLAKKDGDEQLVELAEQMLRKIERCQRG